MQRGTFALSLAQDNLGDAAITSDGNSVLLRRPFSAARGCTAVWGRTLRAVCIMCIDNRAHVARCLMIMQFGHN